MEVGQTRTHISAGHTKQVNGSSKAYHAQLRGRNSVQSGSVRI